MNNQWNALRKIDSELVKYYEISVTGYKFLSDKTCKVTCQNNNDYFIKQTNPNALEKYHFLANQNVNNVLYPLLNKERKYVTRHDNITFYVNDYTDSITVNNEVKLNNMFNELDHLHQMTSLKKQLNPNKSRPKFEEITKRLDFQFRMLEDYVRSVEVRDLDDFSMGVLGNYQYLLDAKRELVRLQKRIISSIKNKDGVEYSFLHNNPRLDHLLNVRGGHYLTSIENGKMGLNSLDVAKLYVENENLNVDYKSLITDYYKNENNPFYYDYFRYLILLIYVRRISITSEGYINAQTFNNTASSIKKYFENFSDYQEEIGE